MNDCRDRRPATRIHHSAVVLPAMPAAEQLLVGPEPVVPEALTSPVLEFEGHQFPITGPVGGSLG